MQSQYVIRLALQTKPKNLNAVKLSTFMKVNSVVILAVLSFCSYLLEQSKYSYVHLHVHNSITLRDSENSAPLSGELSIIHAIHPRRSLSLAESHIGFLTITYS